MSEIKLCKDCKHFRPAKALPCIHVLEGCVRILDLVDGSSTDPRQNRYSADKCGKEARFWEPKE